jgi:branched-chain amino acid transport system permease protein
LSGIYLGVASIGLIFLAEHIALNATNLTGGANGRGVPAFRLGGLSFGRENPFVLFGAEIGQAERQWYLMLVVLILSYWFGRNLLRSRAGCALRAMRDRRTAAAVMGVNIRWLKAQVFTLSAMYAGLSGVLLAVALQAVVPELFTLSLMISFMAMIVIGGVGSAGGAVAGAVVVTGVRQVISQYARNLPFLAAPGSGGVGPAEAAVFVYALLFIAFLLFQPAGLAGIGRRFVRRRPDQVTTTST